MTVAESGAGAQLLPLREKDTSSHQLRTFSPCQPRCQVEEVGVTPRKKERRNVSFTGKGEHFFVGSVTSTRKFVLHTTTVCVCCSLSQQLKNDPVMEKVCVFRSVGPGSLSWYHLFVALQSVAFDFSANLFSLKEGEKKLCVFKHSQAKSKW